MTKVLTLTVTHKSADEMATQYGFNDDQKEHLAALLEEGTSSMWASVLYGVYGEDDQIVAVAASQIGNVGGMPYWSWYGFGSRVEWCACFVSWCANECGYIDIGVILSSPDVLTASTGSRNVVSGLMEVLSPLRA